MTTWSIGTHVPVRIDQAAALPSRADHQQPMRVAAREPVGGVRRCAGRPARGEFLAIEGGDRLAGVGVEQHVDGGDRALAARGIARKHRHQLDADVAAGAPRRHQQQRTRGLARDVDRVIDAQRGVNLPPQRLVERGEHSRPGQARANGRRVEELHQPGVSVSDSNDALPPEAVVLIVIVRSQTRRDAS